MEVSWCAACVAVRLVVEKEEVVEEPFQLTTLPEQQRISERVVSLQLVIRVEVCGWGLSLVKWQDLCWSFNDTAGKEHLELIN